MSRIAAMLALVALVLPLAGCYESTSVERYEPGVYKGKYDPLRQKLRTESLQNRLEERATQAHSDR